MATNKYTQIKYTLNGGSLKNRYLMIINIPDDDTSTSVPLSQQTKNLDTAEFLNIMCQSTSVPDRKIGGVKSVYFRGRKTVMRTLQEYEDSWTVSVVEDNKFNVRKLMEVWLLGVDDQDSDSIWAGYKTSAQVYQLAPDDETIIFGYSLEDLFVSDIGRIEYTDAECDIVRYDITFSYSKCVPIVATPDNATEATYNSQRTQTNEEVLLVDDFATDTIVSNTASNYSVSYNNDKN